MTSEEFLGFLQKRWREPTGIPLLLNAPTLKRALPEYQDSDRILITGSSGGSKTTLTFRLIIDMISYCINNPTKSDVIVLYNCIEMPITEMYLKFLQFIFSKKLGKTYTRDRILNRNQQGEDRELEEDFRKVQGTIDAFNTKIRFVRCFTPTEFGNYCVSILDDLHKIEYKGGKKIIGERKNPILKVVCVVDTSDSFEADGVLKLNKQDSVKYWHKHYTNKLLGNTYGCIMINVIQQDVSSQTAVFHQGNRVDSKHIPSSESISTDKESVRDHSLVLGTLNPYRFHIKQIEGYNVELFKTHLNLIYVLKSNFSTTGEVTALYTDYNTVSFVEIPSPTAHPNLYDAFLKKHGIANTKSKFTFSPETQPDLFLE